MSNCLLDEKQHQGAVAAAEGFPHVYFLGRVLEIKAFIYKRTALCFILSWGLEAR